MRTCRWFTLALVLASVGCGGYGGSNSSAYSGGGSSAPAITNPYAIAYESAKWGSTVTVSFPASCSMTITTTGQPNYTPNAYYLAPMQTPVVAHTAVTNMALGVVAYSMIASHLSGTSVTLNDCPTAAASTTATGLGAIGFLVSGTAMFNPFEADASTPAVSDNASYTFVDGNGASQTAYFLDQCNSHSNGSTWHAHGMPDCVTTPVDGASGPSHIIGIALDGFPIYGGRDINGQVINVSQLDACNGITSPTPEFPNGAYHYVLPVGVDTKFASINCFTGSASQTTTAKMQSLGGHMMQRYAAIARDVWAASSAAVVPAPQ